MTSALRPRRGSGPQRSRRNLPAWFGLLLISAVAVAGCGRPPGLAEPAPEISLPAGVGDTGTPPDGPTPTATPTRTPTPTATPPRVPTPTATGFPVAIAVDCAGRPSADRVIAVLRADGLLPAGARTTVRVAPRCAGSWQYTVVQIPAREPLQVVTEGSPESITLVTAGTDVCVIPVRVGAPAGIRTLACESVPIPPTTP
ncbi:hypothetical protein O7608_05325 [Solwaraspora sp. WMMA2056]|uniref:hypothetical protein n=1 Tax=Solwaraspora sp. WMMA2056 TaxID=3015161 RepID=UPI00259B8708|nr:hypothetical protein [Solwaraspora sp. WMMA2056]WJK41835.1 hypothetical protein O7608_05325 [Solwaraspora sp. WMMA2056]